MLKKTSIYFMCTMYKVVYSFLKTDFKNESSDFTINSNKMAIWFELPFLYLYRFSHKYK